MKTPNDDDTDKSSSVKMALVSYCEFVTMIVKMTRSKLTIFQVLAIVNLLRMMSVN